MHTQNMPNFMPIGQTVADIWPFFILQDCGRWICKSSKFLTANTIRRDNMRLCAKFQSNRSNCFRNMAIFRIFQDGGRPPCKIFKCSKYLLLVWRAIHYYVRTYAKISVTRKFCDFSYVLFAISL